MKKIVLASSSKYKKELLTQLKVPFTACKPNFCEENFKTNLTNKSLSEFLAYKKAESLISTHKNSIIIGCDQVIYVDSKRIDKPMSFQVAQKQLTLMQGRSHLLITSYCLLTNEEKIINSVQAEISIRPLSEIEIKNYLEIDKPFNCAGSYKLESLGISLMDKIETNDFNAITGLPLISLSKDLRKLGINILNSSL